MSRVERMAGRGAQPGARGFCNSAPVPEPEGYKLPVPAGKIPRQESQGLASLLRERSGDDADDDDEAGDDESEAAQQPCRFPQRARQCLAGPPPLAAIPEPLLTLRLQT